METRFSELKQKYFDGKTSLEEEVELKSLLEKSAESEDKELLMQFNYFEEIKNYSPGDEFGAGIERQIRKVYTNSLRDWTFRIAAGVILIAVAFYGGLNYGRSNSKNDQFLSMQNDLRKLHQISTEVLLRQESAHDRLKAMVLVNSIALKPDSITLDLIFRAYTSDDNISIRLSAFELLSNYASDNYIRESLINSITHQDSEIIRYKLIHLALQLKEKSAVPLLERIMTEENISSEMKSEIDMAIKQINS